MSLIDPEHSTLLDIRNLKIQFNTENGITLAVDNVNFKLNKGETLGIVGESGSGKSVTSMSIMRLLGSGQQTEGEIIFDKDGSGLEKRDLLQTSENDMRKIRGNDIAMIFQEPMTSLNPVYTCGDQVMEAIMFHQKVNKKEAKQKTIEVSP